MNARVSKKIRKLARERDLMILPELKDWINNLEIWDRLKVSFRILRRRF